MLVSRCCTYFLHVSTTRKQSLCLKFKSIKTSHSIEILMICNKEHSCKCQYVKRHTYGADYLFISPAWWDSWSRAGLHRPLQHREHQEAGSVPPPPQYPHLACCVIMLVVAVLTFKSQRWAQGTFPGFQMATECRNEWRHFETSGIKNKDILLIYDVDAKLLM